MGEATGKVEVVCPNCGSRETVDKVGSLPVDGVEVQPHLVCPGEEG